MLRTYFVCLYVAQIVWMQIFLGLAGVMLVMLSVLGSVGFFSAIGVKSTLIIMEVIPFLVLAVSSILLFLLILCDVCANVMSQFRFPEWEDIIEPCFEPYVVGTTIRTGFQSIWFTSILKMFALVFRWLHYLIYFWKYQHNIYPVHSELWNLGCSP